MTGFLLLKEKLKSFYGKNDMFIRPVAKFFLALLTICFINGNIGYMHSLKNFFVTIVISLICAALPGGATVLCISLLMVAHLFSLSMELSVVVLLVFLIMYLFYFKFTSKSSIWVVLTLLCFLIKIPYVIPVAAGLLSGAYVAIPVAFGVIMYYIIQCAKNLEPVLAAAENTDMFDNFVLVLGQVTNKEIILIVMSFTLTIIIVYVIRRLSIDFSWIYAIIAGSLTDFVMLLVGNVIFGTSIGFFGIFAGLVLSVIVGLVLNVMFFGVDYSRTERVQYEDDNYYYYVKAVPKYSVAASDVKVKKINTQKKRRTEESDFDEIDIDF